MSVDLAAVQGVVVGASGSLLGRSQVVQGRVLEVANATNGGVAGDGTCVTAKTDTAAGGSASNAAANTGQGGDGGGGGVPGGAGGNGGSGGAIHREGRLDLIPWSA